MNKIKFYRANFIFKSIDVIYAEQETGSFVIVDGQREKRHTDRQAYFTSFQEAKDALVLYWKERVVAAEHMLNSWVGNLETCQELKE